MGNHCLPVSSLFIANSVIFFYQEAKDKLKEINKGVTMVNEVSKQVAVFFCEDQAKFELKKFLITIKTFFDQVHRCQKVHNLKIVSKPKLSSFRF